MKRNCIIETLKIYKSNNPGDFYLTWQMFALKGATRQRSFRIQPMHKDGYLNRSRAALSAKQCADMLGLNIIEVNDLSEELEE